MFKRFKGGAELECLSFLTYFILIILFVISFFCIYNANVSLLGILLLYLVNIIYSIIVVKDIFKSTKSNQAISFILFVIIALTITSSSIIMNSLRKMHATYTSNNEKINLSPKNSAIISTYIASFIAIIVFIWFLTIFFFMEPGDTDFFNFQFIHRMINVNMNGESKTVEIHPILVLIAFIIKVMASISSVALAGFMVYLSTIFKPQILVT